MNLAKIRKKPFRCEENLSIINYLVLQCPECAHVYISQNVDINYFTFIPEATVLLLGILGYPFPSVFLSVYI